MTGIPAVCILPRVEGLGGPASFRARLIAGMQTRGIPIVSDPDGPDCRTILVIGGTRRIPELLRAHRQGIRIVQRLNGMNWIHRRRFTGVGHFFRSEINNAILAYIRRRVADYIVYQSNFARTWWQTVYRSVTAPGTVIYNGVDLDKFTPQGTHQRPEDHFRLLLVEGHLGGGNEMGLRNSAALAELLQERASRPVELMVVGDVPQRLRARLDEQHPRLITWVGVVGRDAIPAFDRSAHMLFSADLNAACPNSVIVALACGLPVVSYATGSLPELIQGDSGLVVPWGSNFWKLEPPDIPHLADAAVQILNDQSRFRAAARERAEAAFGLETMVERYLDVLI
jgi:glycosyltransferase involved in cell wall biosynthesis